MKILCNCGTKYSFDVTPEMVRQPIRFVCQNCGQDSSDVVNQLIRQQFAAPATEAGTAPPALPSPAPPPSTPKPAPSPGLSPSAPTPPTPGKTPLRVALHSSGSTSASAPAPAPASTTSTSALASAPATAPTTAPALCSKHPMQEASHACLVCHKPMCPQCMQVTGLVCSPLCRTKAEAQGIEIPEYALQRDVAQRRQWRKVGAVVGAIAAVVAAVFGFWFWYAWFGSVPKVAYAHSFAHSASHGHLHHGPNHQMIVLHGGTLARHDLDSGKVVWSVELFDRAKVSADSAAELAERIKAREQAAKNGEDAILITIPNLETITRMNMDAAESVFSLHATGENVWIASGNKLTRYAWPDGSKSKEVELDDSLSETLQLGNELVFASAFGGSERALRVDLVSGESKTEGPPKAALTPKATASRGAAGAKSVAAAGAPAKKPTPGATNTTAKGQSSKPIDGAKLAARAQNLPYPNRAALPATIAAAENQRRTQAAMNDDADDGDDAPAAPRAAPKKPGARQESFETVERARTADGTIELGVRLLEEKIVTREAMKAAPKISALEGTVNAAATVDIANELFNEMQRERGSTVEEDMSRYQVTVRRGSSSIQPWTGEVVGPPSLHPLKTVDVIAAGKSILVLDKQNKKRWESKLNFAVGGSGIRDDMADVNDTVGGRLSQGEGPCVERGDTLYVFDQGVLTSFALADGSARWRLPSVGTVGLWFDAEGMIYLNTTTATPDSIKYSKQIDISQKTHNLILKIDPQTGRTLWGARQEGWVTYLWGNYVYTAESSGGMGEDEAEADAMLGVQTGLEIPAHIRLKRLDSGNGRVLWEHYQKRQPLDVRFDQNTIQLLFKKQFQNLKFVVL